MNESLKRAGVLTIVLLVGGAAAALAWPAHATADAATPSAAPRALPALAGEWDTPEPPEPPDPPDPPDPPEGADDDGVMIISSGMTWLGVRIDEVSEEKASAFKMKEAYGALVTNVEESSPAQRAGLKENDVVVSYQGQRVESTSSLRRFVRETPAGRNVAIDVIRDGSPRSFTVTIESRSHSHSHFGRLGRMPGLDFKEFKIPGMFWSGGGPRLGVSVNDLNEQLAEYFGVKPGEGVLVTEVFEGTPAEKAGIKAGDVILRVDNQRVESSGDIHDAIHDKSGKDVDVIVMRDHRERTLKVTLESSKDGEMRSFFPRGLDEGVRQEVMKARAEALHAGRMSREQQRQTMREVQRALREAARARRDAVDRIRVRIPQGDLIEI